MDPRPLLIVDAANVVGSRPDGWWRDRAGAAARLRDRLVPLAAGGLPPELPGPTEVVLVVEGAARGVPAVPGVRVVAAPGSGDDAIVELVGDAPERHRLVVTADRELRGRVGVLGAQVRGPRWLRDAPTPRNDGGPGDGQGDSDRRGGDRGDDRRGGQHGGGQLSGGPLDGTH